MLSSQKEFLCLFGWDGFFESQIEVQPPNLVFSSLYPARVICEEKNLYRIQLGLNDVRWASVSGKMQFNAMNRVDYPAVGDWVLAEVPDQADRAVIHRICPRKSIIYRKQVGSSADMQILSTNVDYAFITTALNNELNYRRIERYLAVAWDSGATPVILLTKSDIYSEKVVDALNEARREFPNVDIHAISKNDFEKENCFREYLKEGKTSVVIGSSGVGKSTLVNFLIGEEQIKTQNVRESDSKGRHTTTSRSLYVSRYGSLIIDTPGMRELQLADHMDGVSVQFSDIESLISKCRFNDCQHKTEPSCKIRKALADDSLSEECWKSYQKLASEVRHAMRKQNKELATEDRKLWKKISINAGNKNQQKKGVI
ncbi:MAG: ribosome small subunit-dependent GTPase A [Pseudobdellovibrio sp.]